MKNKETTLKFNKKILTVLLLSPLQVMALSILQGNKFESNFSRNSAPDANATQFHGLEASNLYTKSLGGAKRLLKMTSDLEYYYSPSNDATNSTFEFKNEMVFDFKSSNNNSNQIILNQGYFNKFAHDDEFEFIKDQYYELGASVATIQNLSSSVLLNARAGFEVEDYTSPSSETIPDQKDNLITKAEVAPSFKINKTTAITFKTNIKRTMMRTKKALTRTGSELGGTEAETLQKLGTKLQIDYINAGLSFFPFLGTVSQTDDYQGGKDYSGLQAGFEVSFDNSLVAIGSTFRIHSRDYDNQRIDTENASTANLSKEIVELSNEIEIKKFLGTDANFVMGYEVEKINSNRPSDEADNQTYEVGLRFNL